MELYLLRHAIAVERGTPGFEADHLRPLTNEGRAKMEQMAAGMATLELKFDVILTSPYVRAHQTAEIAAAALKQAKKLRHEPTLQADRSPQEFVARLAGKLAGHERILAVGHEPFLSSLATLLLGLPGGAALVMKKGGLCKLAVSRFKPRPAAQLEWLLTPRQLRLLAAPPSRQRAKPVNKR
jgi:phosphohistidine phosphatase